MLLFTTSAVMSSDLFTALSVIFYHIMSPVIFLTHWVR